MYPHCRYSQRRILICRRFYKLLKQVAAVSDVRRWILFQYLIVFVPLNSPLALFPIYSDPLSLYAKHFHGYNFTKNIENTSKFSWEPSESEISEGQKKKEIECQLLKIIVIMLILFSLTAFGICCVSTPHFIRDLYSESFEFLFFAKMDLFFSGIGF